MIRRATPDDIPALLAIEEASFQEDRFSRRQFHHLLTKGHAVTLVAVEGARILGYAVVLFHRGTSLARLYSMAVRPEARGRGLGRELLAAAEDSARQRGAAYLRLEVRLDNAVAQALYRDAGFRNFGLAHDYYEDGTDAQRMEKTLAPQIDPGLCRVPFYEQTLDFTCGPAALLMAMRALDPSFRMDQTMELRIWRETTSIFMTAGHGGCGPYGMALFAHRNGFAVEVYVSDQGVLLADGVRGGGKRRVMELVQQDFREQLRETPVRILSRPIQVSELERKYRAGGIPLVLISSYRLIRDRSPHWVVVTGFTERFLFVHDPYVDPQHDRTRTDCMQMPILREEFGRMARYGRSRLKAALILSRRVSAGEG